MPRLELEIGDERLNHISEQAYAQRQQGDIQFWQTKLTKTQGLLKDLQGLPKERIDGVEAARLQNDIATCEQELTRLTTEAKRVAEHRVNPRTGAPFTIQEIRLELKPISRRLNRPTT
jgi:hypothetical protein